MHRFLSFLLIIFSVFLNSFPLTMANGSTLTYDNIKLGAEWFLNNQNENFLHYEYLPFEDRYLETNHPLREMASMWAIARAGNFFEDDRYATLANRGFDYFEKYFKEDLNNNFYYVKIDDKESTIAYSAFIILTLLEIDHPKKDFYLEQFGAGILNQLQTDGSFKTVFFSDVDKAADYYPGEALLAIMSLYEYNHDEKYLTAAKNAFKFYPDYWRKTKNTAFVPWHAQADYKLYQATKDEAVKDFIFEMNDYLIEGQSLARNCKYLHFKRGIVIGVFLEGMNKAYSLAKDSKEQKRTVCYEKFIKKGAKYVLSLQIRQDNDFGLTPIPPAALGGFLGSKKSKLLRVDNNQHSIMGLMEAYRLGLIK